MALYLSNSEVSVISMIGFVMLSGIIVNNGIVMVDYMNQLRAEGREKREAILLAGKTRLRPVLMTALTTIFGLFTIAFAGGMGADLSRLMALVTIVTSSFLLQVRQLSYRPFDSQIKHIILSKYNVISS